MTGGGGVSSASGSKKLIMTSVSLASSARTLSHSSSRNSMARGNWASESLTWSKPSSIRLAMEISPSRVSSSTVPISRMYIRTGSVVRPNSASTLASAAAASSAASSLLSTLSSVRMKVSASGAFSRTDIPMSLIMLIISSTCSGSTILSGKWSLTSA